MAKEKKVREPQFYVSATGMQTVNYNVYYLTLAEKVLYFLLAFIVGAAVGYLFYGGIGKDEFGNATSLTNILNCTISGITGIAAGIGYLGIREKQILRKRKNSLKLQFRELLDALSTSLGSGKNVVDSFRAAHDDLAVIYQQDAFIIRELNHVLVGYENSIDIEESLLDFGTRSGIDDISSFANVFDTCNRKGGNIKDVIKSTQQILVEKMEVEGEIETIVTGARNEQNIMSVMPVALVALIKFTSPDFAANFATSSGIASTTIAIVLFVAAFFVGKKVLAIKV